jgi:hypothetical protein
VPIIVLDRPGATASPLENGGFEFVSSGTGVLNR